MNLFLGVAGGQEVQDMLDETHIGNKTWDFFHVVRTYSVECPKEKAEVLVDSVRLVLESPRQLLFLQDRRVRPVSGPPGGPQEAEVHAYPLGRLQGRDAQESRNEVHGISVGLTPKTMKALVLEHHEGRRLFRVERANARPPRTAPPKAQSGCIEGDHVMESNLLDRLKYGNLALRKQYLPPP
jgi:hypothetical protein